MREAIKPPSPDVSTSRPPSKPGERTEPISAKIQAANQQGQIEVAILKMKIEVFKASSGISGTQYGIGSIGHIC
jgi:hypothetical protein